MQECGIDLHIISNCLPLTPAGRRWNFWKPMLCIPSCTLLKPVAYNWGRTHIFKQGTYRWGRKRIKIACLSVDGFRDFSDICEFNWRAIVDNDRGQEEDNSSLLVTSLFVPTCVPHTKRESEEKFWIASPLQFASITHFTNIVLRNILSLWTVRNICGLHTIQFNSGKWHQHFKFPSHKHPHHICNGFRWPSHQFWKLYTKVLWGWCLEPCAWECGTRWLQLADILPVCR